MHEQFSGPVRAMGIGAASTILLAGIAYGVTLMLGFSSLASPDRPIGDPWFTVLEVLILVLAPAMVALMVAVRAWASPQLEAYGLAAVCLMAMLATVTCSVHFVVLTLGRQADWAAQLAFKWPSPVYALDILAWDFFFALSMLFAAPVFRGAGLLRAIRIALVTSAVLALAGLGGVIWENMQLRNIGIAGYLGAFMVSDALLLVLFLRTAAASK